jgi:hypothetical protein
MGMGDERRTSNVAYLMRAKDSVTPFVACHALRIGMHFFAAREGKAGTCRVCLAD